jgi:hypothetical protein
MTMGYIKNRSGDVAAGVSPALEGGILPPGEMLLPRRDAFRYEHMISALLFLQYHSIKNRFSMRIKRLKQPKYLLGAIAGCIYFYFYFWRYLFQSQSGAGNFRLHPAADLLFYESVGALILLIIILAAWIFPHERTSLAFTESEIAFLFPAPISRRGLIHFKLLRSQTAILFTTCF